MPSHIYPKDAEMQLTCYGGTHDGVSAMWRMSEFTRSGDFGADYVDLYAIKGGTERYYLVQLACRHPKADLRIRFKMLVHDATFNKPWPAQNQMKWARDALGIELDGAWPDDWDIFVEIEAGR